MAKDYAKKGIEDVNISYGKLNKSVVDTDIIPATKKILEDCSEVYYAPSGYSLMSDENGNKICVKNKISEEYMGFGFSSTWGERVYNPLTNDYSFENQEYLRMK